jgi:hypothetical protein
LQLNVVRLTRSVSIFLNGHNGADDAARGQYDAPFCSSRIIFWVCFFCRMGETGGIENGEDQQDGQKSTREFESFEAADLGTRMDHGWGIIGFYRNRPHHFQIFGECTQLDSPPDLTHDVKVSMQIVMGGQYHVERFARLVQMAQVRPAVLAARRA